MDVFAALLSGAALLPYDVRRSGPGGLDVWLELARPTVYHSTPSVFRAFLEARRRPSPIESVAVVVLGGEAALPTGPSGSWPEGRAW